MVWHYDDVSNRKGKHLSPAHEQPDSFSVVVVEEGTFSCIERCNGSHVFGTQLKIEDIDILLHSFNVSSFGYDNYAALDKPSQSYLCDGFTILASDFCQERIREEPVNLRSTSASPRLTTLPRF